MRKLLALAFRPWLREPRVSVWRTKRIGWERYYRGFGGLEKKALTTSLLLKEPGPDGEKGVLYCSFEYNWIRILAHSDAVRFFDEYFLVGASSGAALDYAAYASLSGLSRDPHFIGVSNQAQMHEFRMLAPSIVPLSTMACDWVNPAHFSPKPRGNREIDILMVANWLELKRHWLLFEALKHLDPRLNVLLIGRNAPGRDERSIREEARAFGVRQSLQLLTNIPFDQIVEHQCNAKCAAILSDREGSCVATTESFFADTPVVMMRDAYVGSKAYINPQTGLLAGRRNLYRVLGELIEGSAELRPREWACANIGAHRASAQLNDVLKRYSLEHGLPWNRDIEPMQWQYVPAYLDPSGVDRMQRGVQLLRQRHGIELTVFQPPSSQQR
jgi:glycosyltransferase involved in cell wall biosynthesis